MVRLHRGVDIYELVKYPSNRFPALFLFRCELAEKLSTLLLRFTRPQQLEGIRSDRKNFVVKHKTGNYIICIAAVRINSLVTERGIHQTDLVLFLLLGNSG